MIKKRELLRRLEDAEKNIEDIVHDVNLSTDRVEYVMRFLSDKLGYEIKLKDVIKINCGVKSIVQEIEMVPTGETKAIVKFMGVSGCCEGPSDLPTATKPKRKYNKRKK